MCASCSHDWGRLSRGRGRGNGGEGADLLHQVRAAQLGLKVVLELPPFGRDVSN
jgi:hypothetical protein